MLALVLYETVAGQCPFARWFEGLDATSAVRVRRVLARIELGNLGDVKSLGGGVLECRIDAGPGYRVYLGREGASRLVLLGGGTKRRQSADIAKAKDRWSEFQRRRGSP